jgi:arginine decarboxylase
MNIRITSGTGTGPTKLSAFDAALDAAGIANYNLLQLSSVIPANSEIIHGKGPLGTGKWGDRLYLVKADMRINTPNMEAWAGIGWVQDKETGRGLFVEHDGANEQAVRRDIRDSLKALMATRNVDFGEIKMEVVGITCVHEPVCALVAASYQVSGWRSELRAKVPGLRSR